MMSLLAVAAVYALASFAVGIVAIFVYRLSLPSKEDEREHLAIPTRDGTRE